MRGFPAAHYFFIGVRKVRAAPILKLSRTAYPSVSPMGAFLYSGATIIVICVNNLLFLISFE